MTYCRVTSTNSSLPTQPTKGVTMFDSIRRTVTNRMYVWQTVKTMFETKEPWLKYRYMYVLIGSCIQQISINTTWIYVLTFAIFFLNDISYNVRGYIEAHAHFDWIMRSTRKNTDDDLHGTHTVQDYNYCTSDADSVWSLDAISCNNKSTC